MLFNLFYLNSDKVPDNWARELEKQGMLASLQWPDGWGEKKPLVSILAFTIMPNHFHFMLKEIQEGGIKEFMHKFTMAYSKFINAKYEESGSLFQGPYKSQTVQTDEYLRYLAVYIMVKNTFELYPEGGLSGATDNFDKAYEWAIEYPFTSLGDYAGRRNSPIIEKDILEGLFENSKAFKEFARDCILGRRSDPPEFFD